MATVLLKNDWFAPNGARFRKGRVQVPEHLLPLLPSSAEVGGKPRQAPAGAAASLKDHDPERAAGEAEAAATDEAEAARKANAERIRKKLDEERKR